MNSEVKAETVGNREGLGEDEERMNERNERLNERTSGGFFFFFFFFFWCGLLFIHFCSQMSNLQIFPFSSPLFAHLQMDGYSTSISTSTSKYIHIYQSYSLKLP